MLAAIVFIINMVAGCAVLNNNSAKYNFADGYYYSHLNTKKPPGIMWLQMVIL